jgi:hypothetical protein
MGYKRSRPTDPVKDVYCYAVSAASGDYPYLIYSRVSLDKKLQGKRLKIADLPDSAILSYALQTECDEYGGGMGWSSYTVPHSAHGHHNLLNHLQRYGIHTTNKKQHIDDDTTTQPTVMDQMEQHISSNTTSSIIYHAISIQNKKWVTLRVTRQQTQTTPDDLHDTIQALKTALVAVNPSLCCQDCHKTISKANDLVMSPSGDTYCQTCY